MQNYQPQTNVYENADSYLVVADLPGVPTEKLELTLEGGQLRLAGEAAEWRYARALRLPKAVDGEHIKAELKNGVLSVQIPKRVDARPRRITIAEG